MTIAHYLLHEFRQRFSHSILDYMMVVISGYQKLGKLLMVLALCFCPLMTYASEKITWRAHDQFLGSAQISEDLEVQVFLAARTFFLVAHAELLIYFDAKHANILLDTRVESFSAQHLQANYFFSDFVRIERQNINKAVISGIKFPRAGEWLLRFDLKLGNEKKLATIKVKI